MTTQHKNQYDIVGDVVNLTVFNKKGKSFVAQFDLEDLEKVKNYSYWYAQWHKDFNCYIIETKTKINENAKEEKIVLEIIILLGICGGGTQV